MEEIIGGEWKGFTFKMIERDDYPRVLEHMRNNFYLDEPSCRSMKVVEMEIETQDLDTIVLAYLEEGISFMAIDNATNKVAGLRIMAISEDSDGIEELKAALRSELILQFFSRVVELHEEANVKIRLGVDKYGDFLVVSVDKEFRGRGLATELYNRAVKLLQHLGCPAAMSMFSSPYSQKIARNLGFQELTRRPLRKFMHDNGTQIIPNANEDDVGIVMAKKF